MSGSYYTLDAKYNTLLALITANATTGNTLEAVLTSGNDAGGLSMTNLNNVDLATINGASYPPAVAGDNLEQVLTNGNDANGLSIVGINDISLNTINGAAYPPAGGSQSLADVLLVGNSAGATDIDMSGNSVLNALIYECSGTSGQVRVGTGSGATNQGTSSVAVGQNAGQINQANNAIAIGNNSGNSLQKSNAVAIGLNAGQINQNNNSVCVGSNSGNSNQGAGAVALGNAAGNGSQGTASVSVGQFAGGSSQGNNAVAVGNSAGQTSQGFFSVAIGNNAGRTSQAAGAVALGNAAGNSGQGTNAVAIGSAAGQTNQVAGSIALNASGVALNPAVAGFFVNPIRADATEQLPLQYNSTTKEVSNFNWSDLLTPTSYNPILRSSSGSNLNSGNYSVRTGYYIQLGKIVWFEVRIQITGKGGLGLAGEDIQITLPITASSLTDLTQSLNIGNMVATTTNIVSAFANIPSGGQDYAVFPIKETAGTSTANLEVGDISTTFQIRFGGFYFTN